MELPTSYSTLDVEHITVEHVPASSPSPTSVILIKLDRPTKYNAFTLQMYMSLEKVYRLIDQDDRVKAVVLTGAGRMFCAGADLEIASKKALDIDSGPESGSDRIVDHRDT